MRHYPLPERKEALNELSFLDWKDPALFHALGIEPVPMPVRTDRLIVLMKQTKDDVIPSAFYIEGMILLLAADPNFPHAAAYRSILAKEEDHIARMEETVQKLAESDDPNLIPLAIYLLSISKNSVAAAILARYYAQLDPRLYRGSILSLVERIVNAPNPSADDKQIAANLLFIVGEMDRAEHILEEIAYDPKTPAPEDASEMLHSIRVEKAVRSAKEALNQQRYEEVIGELTALSPADRNDIVYFLLAEAQQGLGLYRQSIGNFEKAIELGIEDIDAFNDLSIAHYLTDDVEAAVRVLEEARVRFGNDERILYNLMIYKMQLNELDEANQIYEKLLRMDIRDPEIKRSLEEFLES